MASNVACNLCVTVSKFGKWGTCGKRPILADFAAYHLNNLNGKINGSRRENIRSAIRNQNDKSGCQRVTSSCRSLFWRCPDYGTCHFPCLILFPWMYSPLQSISLPSLLHFVWKRPFLTRFPRSCTLICTLALTIPYDKVFLKKTLTLKFIYIFVHRDPWSLKQLLNV